MQSRQTTKPTSGQRFQEQKAIRVPTSEGRSASVSAQRTAASNLKARYAPESAKKSK